MAGSKSYMQGAASIVNHKQYCVLCGKESNGLFGNFFSSLEVRLSVHQYCLFFASGLAQNGDDNEGFDGFLPEDILKEASRGKQLKCSFCRKSGATIGCAVQTCKIRYHYPCGKQNGTLEQFFGPFDAFCKRHKPLQNSPREEWIQATCAICLDSLIEEGNCQDFLKMPCCTGNYMHKDCLQKHASSSGYFCTCPTCKNCDEFLLEMKVYGIYIPERDALWEEDNAFADLLQVYNRCDCRYCYCPNGRHFSTNSGSWKMYRCQICGHSASHLRCAEAEGKHFFPFKCNNCINIELQSQFREKIDRQTRSCAVSLSDIATYIAARMISFAESRNGSINICLSNEEFHGLHFIY